MNGTAQQRAEVDAHFGHVNAAHAAYLDQGRPDLALALRSRLGELLACAAHGLRAGAAGDWDGRRKLQPAAELRHCSRTPCHQAQALQLAFKAVTLRAQMSHLGT